MNKRLLKDLPFQNLKAGTVIVKAGRGHGGEYSVSQRTTYYEHGGDSSGGLLCFERNEEEIITAIWNNKDWFEDADLKHIEFIARPESITLRFKPIDQEEAEELMKGIMHIMKHLKDGSYVWNKFYGFTVGKRSN